MTTTSYDYDYDYDKYSEYDYMYDYDQDSDYDYDYDYDKDSEYDYMYDYDQDSDYDYDYDKDSEYDYDYDQDSDYDHLHNDYDNEYDCSYLPTFMYHPSTSYTRITVTRYDTRVIRNKPRYYIAKLYTTWIAQLIERSYVKREVRSSTPGSGLYLSAIWLCHYDNEYKKDFENAYDVTMIGHISIMMWSNLTDVTKYIIYCRVKQWTSIKL